MAIMSRSCLFTGLFFLAFCVGCRSTHQSSENTVPQIYNAAAISLPKAQESEDPPAGTILESYTDDSNVGKRHHNKVEIRIIKGSDIHLISV